ncbi:hypothetical protein Q3G72_022053 [Acer saccharum]|nr:hypothetical protein Q3G72_022053 [Acer saccharum]
MGTCMANPETKGTRTYNRNSTVEETTDSGSPPTWRRSVLHDGRSYPSRWKERIVLPMEEQSPPTRQLCSSMCRSAHERAYHSFIEGPGLSMKERLAPSMNEPSTPLSIRW